jgi:lipopolysaccharide/colanic/teichoic acid biosynthesis glycosyltransferase
MLKRSLDFLEAGTGLICFFPFLAIIAAAIKLTSPGPVFFRQERVGLNGRIFRIFKFRSMRADSHLRGAAVTTGDDERVTRLGAFLRRHKLDELPQLINVLTGDMAMVGPRPEVKEFVDLFPGEYARILKVRPGITHQGTLMFRNEEAILAGAPDPRARYLQFVMPLKLKIYQDHLEQLYTEELKIILATVFPSVWMKAYPAIQIEDPTVARLPAYAQQTARLAAQHDARVAARAEKAMEEMA